MKKLEKNFEECVIAFLDHQHELCGYAPQSAYIELLLRDLSAAYAETLDNNELNMLIISDFREYLRKEQLLHNVNITKWTAKGIEYYDFSIAIQYIGLALQRVRSQAPLSPPDENSSAVFTGVVYTRKPPRFLHVDISEGCFAILNKVHNT